MSRALPGMAAPIIRIGAVSDPFEIEVHIAGQHLVDVAGAGAVEEDGFFAWAETIAHIDTDAVASFYGSTVGHLLIDADLQLVHRNGLGLRDRGEGQDDSTAQSGDDEFAGAPVLAVDVGRCFNREASAVDLDLGIFPGQANGDWRLGHWANFHLSLIRSLAASRRDSINRSPSQGQSGVGPGMAVDPPSQAAVGHNGNNNVLIQFIEASPYHRLSLVQALSS